MTLPGTPAGNRGGVYYEAGFAFGLGKTVIHTCSESQLKSSDTKEQLHFDVKHLKMITWTVDRLAHFSESLKEHIRALFDKGPISHPTSSQR